MDAELKALNKRVKTSMRRSKAAREKWILTEADFSLINHAVDIAISDYDDEHEPLRSRSIRKLTMLKRKLKRVERRK